uniref:Ovalbumin-like n=1 Tax=Dromaius novaehollandiae TaxID=8790 RepID=A0A8C4JKD5_DRONO
MGSISAANAEFCFDMFKELRVHHTNENIIYSPLSILSVLSMVYLGAKGNTESQMEKVSHLHINAKYLLLFMPPFQCGTSEYIHNSFKDLLSEITMPNASYSLKTADRIYVEKTYPIFPEYLKCAKKFYKAELVEADFKKATEEARQLINSWVEKETSGQIQDFLEPGSVDLNTALLLINAIYFKGMWKKAFREEDTQEVLFSMTKQESKPVQMMCQNGTFKIAVVADEKIKVLELPYAGRELSMLVLLPEDASSLEQLESTISFEKLTEWTSPNMMEKKTVKVYLPRMKIEEKYNLTSVLTALGMTDLFSPLANLSGISAAETLKMSEALHEASMEVSEAGTEVAGSTGAMGEIKHSPVSEEFRADHPFLFLIKHNPTNIIIFFGRCFYP